MGRSEEGDLMLQDEIKPYEGTTVRFDYVGKLPNSTEVDRRGIVVRGRCYEVNFSVAHSNEVRLRDVPAEDILKMERLDRGTAEHLLVVLQSFKEGDGFVRLNPPLVLEQSD